MVRSRACACALAALLAAATWAAGADRWAALAAAERAVLKAALEWNQGPCLVDAEVEKEDNVYPMIPGGQSVNEMLDTPIDPDGGSITIQPKGSHALPRKDAHVPVTVH